MRTLAILFAALIGVAHSISRGYIRKRFIVSLKPESECDSTCVEAVKRSIVNLVYEEKPARCQVLRHNVHLGMITVRCGSVRSDTTAMLVKNELEQIEGVMYASQDAILTTTPTDSEAQYVDTTGSSSPGFVPISRKVVPQGFAPYNWGLDRIDEEDADLDYFSADYSCYPKMGKGVRVFVIDTGCRTDHSEFVNLDITTEKAPGSKFSSGNDDNGHGTHIAGVIGGANVGIARNTSVTCIKAFDHRGNGMATDTINAVEYILEEKAKNTSVPFIVNLSYSALTGYTTTPLDEIVYASSARGIIFVVSAGNSAVNSCFFSPSKAKEAFTVTASTRHDSLEVDSNIGPCVEFIAPGHEILSASIDSPTDYDFMNGTSMATPHVVGLSALVLAENMHLQKVPEIVRAALYEKLLSRTADVANFLMPLMHVECSESQSEVSSRRSGNKGTLSPRDEELSPDASAEASVEPFETEEPSAEGLITSLEPENEPATPLTFSTSSSEGTQKDILIGTTTIPKKRNRNNHETDIMLQLMQMLQDSGLGFDSVE
ncbi:unnamed protein product [Agarophyton chilense]|eukprot:gb/GEZJ01003123.1/.p1 GENE.gb/GEZJ01003123.1/~~gb/GEZJ01003123.1/.p1  ORF type:complete len:545 (+),score=70.27 gb/GEZJ01003123.1/:1262-2896(+)